jgi:penicillin V amidase
MCTSIFTKTKDNKHLLARTMDFSYPLGVAPIYIPRNYEWTSTSDQQTRKNKLGFLGTGEQILDTYFVSDGVNEAGISIAELYLPGETVYQKEADAEKMNFCPHEFIVWVLGNIDSLEGLEKALPTINLVDRPVPELGFVTPLHWIISDQNGRSVVIEPTEKVLHIKENPVNVMTNTPQLEWHIQNLRNYLNVQPNQLSPVDFDTFKATPFSQGTGTSGLPGGYTPPERFVRAAFFKEHIDQAANEEEGVMNALNILATVSIPKGIVLESTGGEDYSQFISVMCNETKSIYYKDYGSNSVTKATITEELLNQTTVQKFAVDRTLTIRSMKHSSGGDKNE